MNYAATSIADDLKYELVDGSEYLMSPPKINHLRIGSNLHRIISHYLHGKRCKVFYEAPVIFDEKNHFIPDILVICDKNKIKPDAIYGAPDFVVEILSPSTRRKDMVLKLNKYLNAGVREYWIVDPKTRKVMTYDLTDELILKTYDFSETIPVGIFDGKIKIPFSEVLAELVDIFGEDF